MNELINKNISVFLPAYNEEENIKATVLAVNNYLKTRFKDYEILVVSEGSIDRTNEIVADLQKDIKEIKLFTKKKCFGYAGALRTGFLNSTKELIFYTDADQQFDINDLDKLLPWIGQYDIITGFKIKRQDAVTRKFTSWVYNTTMRIVFGLKLRDINCAFKLYKREVIEKINFLSNLTEGVINAEVYLTALKNGYIIREIGINHFPRKTGLPVSQLGTRRFVFVKPIIIYRFFKDTVRLWIKEHKTR